MSAPEAKRAISAAAECVVIHNPTAGRRRQQHLSQVLAALRAAGVAVETVATRARGDATALARAAEAAGTRVVAVAGGDGTISEAINGLTGRAALALVPLGTANVLAAELGLPDDPQALAAIIASGSPRRTHPGEIEFGSGETRRFAMMASVGFDAHVAADVPLRLKRAAGKLAYAWRGLVEWLRLPRRRYRVTADGVVHECVSAIIAKGRFYAGRFVAAPDASLERDSFELVLFEHAGRGAVLRHVLALGFGRLARSQGVRILRAREIVIEGATGEPVQADGDVVGRLPVRITIAPWSLAVLVPAHGGGAAIQ